MKLCKAILLSVVIALVCSPLFAEEVIRVGVLRFESKAEGISQYNAESITDELTRMLTSSYSIAIIDRSEIEAIAREHRMNLAGLIDSRTAAKLGHAAGIQYLITGAITNFGVTEEITKTDTTGLWELIGGKNTAKHLGSQSVEKKEVAEVTLDVRIIDVNTHEVVLSMAETGNATRTTKVTAGNDNSGSANSQIVSLRDAAVSDAVAKIGQRIKEAVAGEYPQVLRVSGEDIFIGLGATSGVKVGNRYKVCLEGEEITDMRGKVIGRETTVIALVRIENVKNDYSVARVIKKGGKVSNVHRGDRVELVSGEEINTLISRKAIPDKRPRRRFGDSGLEGAELDNRLSDISSTTKEEGTTVRGTSVTEAPGSARTRSLENSSTDPARVIPTYGLPAGEARSREDLHRRLQSAGKTRNAYARYVEMANSYSGDYLAMYQAGVIAKSLGNKRDAAMWFDKALSANPNYEPAIRAKENLNKPVSSPSRPKSTKKRRK